MSTCSRELPALFLCFEQTITTDKRTHTVKRERTCRLQVTVTAVNGLAMLTAKGFESTRVVSVIFIQSLEWREQFKSLFWHLIQ